MIRPSGFLHPFVGDDRGAELRAGQTGKLAFASGARNAPASVGKGRQIPGQLRAVAAGIEIGEVPFRQGPEFRNVCAARRVRRDFRAVRPSRRPPCPEEPPQAASRTSGLLRMMGFGDAILNLRHPEVGREATPRRTRGDRAALFRASTIAPSVGQFRYHGREHMGGTARRAKRAAGPDYARGTGSDGLRDVPQPAGDVLR